MSAHSKIEWTHHTFNPWWGCDKVSPGCAGCYAEAWAKRTGHGNLWQGARRRMSAAYWRQPLKWDRAAAAAGERHRVFCASMADVFDNVVMHEWRADLFSLIRDTPNLDWLLLTKRIGNARGMLEAAADWHFNHGDRNVAGWLTDWYRHGVPPAGVWLGATVINQAEVDRDVPKLLATPARVHFVSCEPLLEWVYLGAHFRHDPHPRVADLVCDVCQRADNPLHAPNAKGLDWIIVGGESGGKSRPFHVEWARTLIAQCSYFGAKVFVKQVGNRPHDVDKRAHDWPRVMARRADGSLVLEDRKGGNMDEWPISLRRREFPPVIR